jgi:hypothetical protein
VNKPGFLIVAAVLVSGLAACSGSASPPAATATTPAARSTPSSAGKVSTKGAGVNATVSGLVTLIAPGSILVESNTDAQEASLADDTVVLDIKGHVCTTGSPPRRCTWHQLEHALGDDTSNAFYAKVVIKGGVAVRVEEIAGQRAAAGT